MSESTTEQNSHDWVLVLAGGDGKRLRSLTSADGVSVPKQYCSLAGGKTLLDDAIERAQRFRSRCQGQCHRRCPASGSVGTAAGIRRRRRSHVAGEFHA